MGQEPRVTKLPVTVGNMAMARRAHAQSKADVLAEFARRLNQLCDETEIPPKGRGRQTELARIFRVSQKGARKWLEGEGLPSSSMTARIAIHFGVTVEWVRTGREPKRLFSSLSPKHRSLIEAYDHADHDAKLIVDTALKLRT